MTDPNLSEQPIRCFWVDGSQIYRDYHDSEWGFPVYEDRRLFEKICLEGFQSGLSWITILKKRENFRAGFANFRLAEVARFGDKDIERLMQDAGIVRHRGKIEAAINNARCAEKLLESESSLAAYFWKFEPSPKSRPQRITRETLRSMTQCAESVALSKDLKKRGWKFVGPTTMYAFMQAMGLVNDHEETCFVREAALQARKAFDPNTL
ncbi:DNA-3-methyladenine glycosylase I [Rhodoferax lacus]|uniref:DNA-3-methyladenine glycosylase I n=1 Tax=Rhodoferax lacus TaxID=2184758 RepID=A0A3E1REN1_9BURK|nr:DNA-3-methyladenine glycosylase I [Rhodoferax lacus]RFO97492.1 DNA-3-methyladenine glycosylase I [Rhodoferax lacus]